MVLRKKKSEPVEKVIRSTLTGGLKTGGGTYAVEKDEVLVATFTSEAEYKRLLTIQSFVPATEDELLDYANRIIPVITEDVSMHHLEQPVSEVPIVPEPVEELLDGDIKFESVESTSPEGEFSEIEPPSEDDDVPDEPVVPPVDDVPEPPKESVPSRRRRRS